MSRHCTIYNNVMWRRCSIYNNVIRYQKTRGLFIYLHIYLFIYIILFYLPIQYVEYWYRCDVIWRGGMWRDVTWCDRMWIDVTGCDVIWRDATWCDVTWCDVMWRGVTWCDLTWWGVTWCVVNKVNRQIGAKMFITCRKIHKFNLSDFCLKEICLSNNLIVHYNMTLYVR